MRNLKDGALRRDSLLREEDLNVLDEEIYQKGHSELKARDIFYVKTDISAGAETVSYDKLEEMGEAKVTANGADDIPLVDANLERTDHGIVTIESGFKIGKQEARAAQEAGRAIDTVKAGTARRVVSEKENTVTFLGNEARDIEGAVNATGMLTYTVEQNEDETSTSWEDKTGMEIVKDIRKAKGKMNDLDGFEAQILALAPSKYGELDKPLNQYNAQTVMSYLENDTNWFEDIVEVNELSGADPDDSSDIGMIIDNRRENIEMVLPMDITRDEPVKLSNGDIQVNLEERFGGLIIRYPQALLRIKSL
ncbi:MAG: encapsulin [Halanaerobacter sp.]